ncbi:MAG: hypothetical protein AB1782_20985 [Cyanobacteriota bacterium]
MKPDKLLKRYRTFLLSFIILLFLVLTQIDENKVFSQMDTAVINGLKIQLNNASFKKSHIGNLDITANGANFETGKIQSLQVICSGYQNKSILLDQIAFKLDDISFYSENLLSNQELILKYPVEAKASIVLSENGLNAILNRPKTLEKLSKLSQVKIKKFGIQLDSGLISFMEPRCKILTNNMIQIDMLATLGNMVGFPVTFTTELAVINNKLVMVSPNIITSGLALPKEVSGIINDKLLSIIQKEEDKIKEDVEIKATSVNSVAGERIILTGSALIKKLKFSKKEKIQN